MDHPCIRRYGTGSAALENRCNPPVSGAISTIVDASFVIGTIGDVAASETGRQRPFRLGDHVGRNRTAGRLAFIAATPLSVSPRATARPRSLSCEHRAASTSHLRRHSDCCRLRYWRWSHSLCPRSLQGHCGSAQRSSGWRVEHLLLLLVPLGSIATPLALAALFAIAWLATDLAWSLLRLVLLRRKPERWIRMPKSGQADGFLFMGWILLSECSSPVICGCLRSRYWWATNSTSGYVLDSDDYRVVLSSRR